MTMLAMLRSQSNDLGSGGFRDHENVSSGVYHRAGERQEDDERWLVDKTTL